MGPHWLVSPWSERRPRPGPDQPRPSSSRAAYSYRALAAEFHHRPWGRRAKRAKYCWIVGMANRHGQGRALREKTTGRPAAVGQVLNVWYSRAHAHRRRERGGLQSVLRSQRSLRAVIVAGRCLVASPIGFDGKSHGPITPRPGLSFGILSYQTPCQ